MNTRDVSAVVAVAKCGSFTLAAREMRVLQSTLSRQVAALERQLGAMLFRRAAGPSRELCLTESGKAFLPHAELLLAEVRRAELAAKVGRSST